MKALRVLFLALVLVVGVAVSLAAVSTPSQASVPNVLKFETMVGVTAPYTGATGQAIRGIHGGGLPWRLTSAKGELSSTGHLEVKVRGLVLAAGANEGINPVASFKAIVSCESIDSTGSATTTNVETGLFPASTAGNANIEADVTLPHPCIAPVVFVTSPGGAWFAATGN